MNLTDFKKRLLWGLGILFILILWITFPLIFKEWVFTLLVKPPFTPEVFATLGPIGDIFGGLTALFTSATLIIVMYSAYLQKQANKDAREAIAEQLKQAREATEEQLKQAKEATEEQLKQARESTKLQLELAHDTHYAQIKETKYSIFSNTFYALLNQKQESFKNLKLIDQNGNEFLADQIFYNFSKKFLRLLRTDWSDLTLIDEHDVLDAFNFYIRELNNNKIYTDIHSYFGYYVSLVELIRRSEIDDSDKIFFTELLTMSISTSEQLTLFWISCGMDKLKLKLRGSKIFDLNLNDLSMPFAVKFYDKSYFIQPNVLKLWDEYVKKQNPA